jgi:predicted dehydrogenase
MTRLKWGMIGGGEGSQIGPAHRLGAGLDGEFEFAAGALDHRPEAGRDYGKRLGLDRTVPMATGARCWTAKKPRRPHRPGDRRHAQRHPLRDHQGLSRGGLSRALRKADDHDRGRGRGHRPHRPRDRKDLRGQLRLHRLFAGAPHEGDGRAWRSGQDPLVKAEFAHGHHADAADADNPRVRWRYDPAQAGVSAQFADCGIHALHMASFVTGQEVEKLSADTVSCISSRELEDDAMVNFRMDGGTVGRLWTSSIAIGRQHGLTLQVFGEKGGLRWAQEQPNQLYWMPLGGRLQVIERGEANLSPEADRTSRVTIGHAEGMPLAFANIYKDLAEAIRAEKQGRAMDPAANLYPRAEDGLRSMAAVFAVAESGKADGIWVDARPPMFR